jgi:hypothetical protein
MRVKTEFLADWIFEMQWLELLKNELSKRVPDRNIRLIIEDNSSADYVMKINGKGDEVVFLVNIHERVSIETIFKQSYLDGVMEHEIKHLNPNVTYQHDVIPAPSSIFRKHGIKAHNYYTKLLTDTFQNYLNEIYANSDMSIRGLHKYLEFEVYKLREVWFKRHSTLRIMWMLIIAYIEVCYNMIGDLIPSKLLPIVTTLRKRPIDASIYDQIKVTYKTMWNAVKSEQRNVNLLKETYELNELVWNQRNPFF